MKHLKELIARKKVKGDVIDEDRAQARGSVLEDLIDDMGAAETDKLKGLKKVTVAAPDSESLEKGLKTAEGLVKKMPVEMDEEEVEEVKAPSPFAGKETEEEELAEHEAMDAELSPEELEEKIKKLQELLEKKSSHMA
jgi:hypothetical protein